MVLEFIKMGMGGFLLSCRFKNCADDLTWVFIGVYGPTMGSMREDL